MNNIRYSANVTRMVNRGIGLGSRPLGKGSRATSYNAMIRSNVHDVSDHVANMRFKMSRSTHCHGTDKWILEDNSPAHRHNLTHILYFSQLLQRKNGSMPSLPTVVEFIVFLIKHPSQFQFVGSFKVQKISSSSTPPSHPPSWETSTSIPSLDTWQHLQHTPDFNDEIDEIDVIH